MATKVLMPQLGESVTEGTITKWLVKVGDQVKKYDPLAEVSTDKVNAEVPSTVAGRVTEIVVPEGDTVAIGTLILYIEEEGEGPISRKIPPLSTVLTPASRQKRFLLKRQKAGRLFRPIWRPMLLQLQQGRLFPE